VRAGWGCGCVLQGGGAAGPGLVEVLEAKGLDMVRRDWCPLSKDTGNYALQQILSGGLDTLHGARPAVSTSMLWLPVRVLVTLSSCSSQQASHQVHLCSPEGTCW